MNTFETYLIENGIYFEVAGRYGRIADKYIQWLKDNGLKAHQVKRSKYLEWIQECRASGNVERTIVIKENVIKHYYYFLGTKNNPAITFLTKKKEHTLPPNAFKAEELIQIYEKLKPKSPADYRNRCMLGFVLFQGLKRDELAELRTQDIDFETGYVFVQGQRRSNSRRLKLESFQMLHLYDYFHKFRKDFVVLKKDSKTDKLFLSKGKGEYLNNTVTGMLFKLKRDFPQIENLLHIRGSVITNWQKNDGIMEAMVNAGHRYISSTQRYQTNKYEELHEQLKSLHPLESITFVNT